MPDYGVSTPEAFAAYDKVGSSHHPDCEAQEAAIRAEDLAAVCRRRQRAGRMQRCQSDNEAIKAAAPGAHGAVTALMTGSGAAVFGVFGTKPTPARAAAEAAKAAVAAGVRGPAGRGGAGSARIKCCINKPPFPGAYWPQRKGGLLCRPFIKSA